MSAEGGAEAAEAEAARGFLVGRRVVAAAALGLLAMEAAVTGWDFEMRVFGANVESGREEEEFTFNLAL